MVAKPVGGVTSERPTPASRVAALAGAHTTRASTIPMAPRTGLTITARLWLGGSEQRRRIAVDAVARYTPHRVARGFPHTLLARVLPGEAVVLRTVYLDDQPSSRPDQVRFLARDPDVHARRLDAGVVKQLEGSALRIGAGAVVGQAGIARHLIPEQASASAAAVAR